MRTLNLGILAHVDAGKTSLTERLLFNAGAIARLGSVDAGNTQTDSLDLERQRGITIRAAVASFVIGATRVNLLDTPGHPDFIAEVERVLGLLDAAIVVVSAVEGVQAQTRVLVRALKRLGVPFVFFINKVDRPGARHEGLLDDLAAQLSTRPLAMAETFEIGSKTADVFPFAVENEAFRAVLRDRLTEEDDVLLADYVQAPESIDTGRLTDAMARQVAECRLHPAYCGSAMTGIGVEPLLAAVDGLLPSRQPDPLAEIAGTVFKIERGWGGEKIAYVSLDAGTIHTRDMVELPTGPARVTGIEVFDGGQPHPRPSLAAGRIGRISGLSKARIGDKLGIHATSETRAYFAPPTLETRVMAKRPSENGALWLALSQMAEQDPLINLRRNEEADRVFVSLYGEVQKEVIQSMLLSEYGLDVAFEESTVICVERLVGTGEAIELIGREPNPFLATIGLRIEPRPEGSGVSFALEADFGQMPASFYRAAEDTILETLKQGAFGWQVVDCHVAMIAARHRAPESTAADFRNLAPLVVAQALATAGTLVCEPISRYRIEAPADALGGLLATLARSGAALTESSVVDGVGVLEGTISAAHIHAVQQALPGLSGGAGSMESAFERYVPVTDTPPTRQRIGANPFDRTEYMHALQHASG
ncbi:GTP-binding protein [Devosia sp. D6-9]|nr:GTP-binding protein [Devosia sp. D6-9]